MSSYGRLAAFIGENGVQTATVDLEAIPPEWAGITEHPAFGTAARRLAENMLALIDTDRKLAAVFKDAGHYVAAMSAAYLEARGELNLSTLRQICAGSGFLTANRAGALIDFMVHLGFLKRRSAHYGETTQVFRRAWAAHLQAALDAAAILDPAVAPVRDALDDSEMYQRFLTTQGTRLHQLARMADPSPALRAAFLHPLAGSAILHTLTLACTDAAFVPHQGASVPLAWLSRRFGVSEPHVRRVLKGAEANAFLLHLGPSIRAFHPHGFATIRNHYAMQIGELIGCAREVMAGSMAIAQASASASASRCVTAC